jgi:hypothetical protein
VKLLAAAAPKVTALAPSKSVPVITTEVPPSTEPEAGLIAEIVGAG